MGSAGRKDGERGYEECMDSSPFAVRYGIEFDKDFSAGIDSIFLHTIVSIF